ncbi:MAG: TorF family putative porin [Bacteroidota bacterium]
MKKGAHLLQLITRVIVAAGTVSPAAAQDEEGGVSFDAGADIVSNYIFRGTKFGTGPAIQPGVTFTAGNFTLGGWGSYCFGGTEAAESDLYASYAFGFGLTVGITDYYYPDFSYFDYSAATGSHAFELNVAYEIKGLSLAANYVLNEAGNALTTGGDKYFELGYSFPSVSLFVGAGDGWNTSDGSFAVCNVGISTEKELALSESFSLPVSGSVIFNPEREVLYVVVGVSF